ncbi:MAG: nuclear transport factor 2 family protein [Leptolinea sp.]
MGLTGKGFFIWKIRDCESGSPTGIATSAQAAGLSHVLIKIADGMNLSNVDTVSSFDYVPGVVQALHNVGIQVWGWHYVYGGDPDGEAWNGGRRARALGLDGYVIDAEVEYKASGMDAAARRYISDLRGYLGSMPIAICSFRFPSYHMQFPWSDFLNRSDYNMPQVYWEQAHNAGPQLLRSFREFQRISPYRPYLATGPTYSNKGWEPTTADIHDFLTTAISLQIPAVNFFSWDYCRKYLSHLWNEIAAFPYPTSQPFGIVQKLFSALNAHNADMVALLYTENAVHITGERTIQGRAAIRAWYIDLFANRLPNVSFALTSITGSDPGRNFSWNAVSGVTTRRGTDTIGLINGEISYHYSSIN